MRSLTWNGFVEMVTPFLGRIDGVVARESNLEDAGLDSLSLIELVAEIESRLGVEYPADALNWETFSTAGNLYDNTVILLEG